MGNIIEGEKYRIGNFIYTFVEEDDVSKLIVSSVSGEWRIIYNDSHYMYGILSFLLDDEKCHKYIDALFVMIYTASSYPHDMVSLAEKEEIPFINGFCKLIDEQTAFETSVSRKVSDEEDREALDDIVRMQETLDELDRLESKQNGVK